MTHFLSSLYVGPSLPWPISLLPLFFSLHPSLCKLGKKKKINAAKSVCLNSAHMTFPSSLIASIQFISASHARPQSIKLALFTKKLLSYNNPRNQNAGIMGKAQPDDDGRNKQIFKFPPSRQEASQSAAYGQAAEQSRPGARRVAARAPGRSHAVRDFLSGRCEATAQWH